MNLLVFSGYLGKDPEMRYTPSGHPVTQFSVADTRKWTKSDGESGEETVWINVSAWGRTGEIANQYLRKGSKVTVVGRLKAPYAYEGGASNQVTATSIDIHTWARDDQREDDLAPPEDDIPF